MEFIEPRAIMLAATKTLHDGVKDYLNELGVPDWSTDAISGAEELSEIAGRSCYLSYAGDGKLNPNVNRVREGNETYLGKSIIGNGHGSVLEHSSVTFAFVGVSRVFCYSDDTEVLTSAGWKPWPEVSGEEKFATLRDGELVYENAEERFRMPYVGKMYGVSNEQVDLLVTPNHRMYIQRVDTQKYRRGDRQYEIALAKDIKGKAVRYSKVAKWSGSNQKLVSIPSVYREVGSSQRQYLGKDFDAETFLQFLGYFVSEGCVNKHDTGINLSQNPGSTLEHMKRVLSSLGVKWSEQNSGTQKRLTFKCYALYSWLKDHVGTGASTKRIPEIVGQMSSDFIKSFLDCYVLGDGSCRKDCDHSVIYTTSRAVADELTVLALKSGWAANLRVDDRVGLKRVMSSGQVFENKRPCYVVSLVKTRNKPHVNVRNRQKKQDSWIDYVGEVHCVKVPSGLLYVRRNGKPVWSGNTHELVRHRVGTGFSQQSLRYIRLEKLCAWYPRSFGPEVVGMLYDALAKKGKVPSTPEGKEVWVKDRVKFLRTIFESTYERLESVQREIAATLYLDELDGDFHVKKQITSAMRRLAPIGLGTGIICTANHRAWRHMIALRTAPGAEEEIRLVFKDVARQLRDHFPNVYQDMAEGPEDGAFWFKSGKV